MRDNCVDRAGPKDSDELITTEKPGKPMYRTTLVNVFWLYS